MTPEQVKQIRAELGLTQLQLGQWLMLDGKQPDHTVRMWEIGRYPVGGPVKVCLEAFRSGWVPSHIRHHTTTKGE
jgi:DNA-binding transcriptional regulator YiaG